MNRSTPESEAAANGAAYRLPTNVVPLRYAITLAPDLEKFVFSGNETVRIKIKEATNTVVLNANELAIQSAFLIDSHGARHDGTVELDNEHQFARIAFAAVIDSGECDLMLTFTGELNDKLNGFYRSFYTHPTMGVRPMATTQFETADARKAFPCFDEPLMKARFQIDVVIPDEMAAISNAAVAAIEPVDATTSDTSYLTDSIPDATGDSRPLPSAARRKLKRVRFEETELMSTYLVALCVGDFVASEKVTACGIDIRVHATPGKEHLTSFALKVAKHGVEYFTRKFRVPYGFGKKIDLIAVKNFAAGAMENPGAITFRETAVLIDEKTATIAELKRVAEVVLHELAHMWFGDLVTMLWWTWLWLNESFATFMALVCLDDLFPEWHVIDDFAQQRAAALRLDSLKSTHPIECPVHRPEECDELFDLISYEKGCSVLYMIYSYMGSEHFLDGVSAYLKKFSYGNAEGHDFWDSLQEVADAQGLNLPIRQIMDAWVLTPGHPVVAVKQSGKAAITLTQGDFKFLKEATTDNIWPIPVHLRVTKASGESREQVVLLTEKSQTFSIGEFQSVVVNASGYGFYRVVYEPELLRKLTAEVRNLAVVERYNLLNDTWSAVRAGMASSVDYLELVKLFSRETDPNVWDIIVASLRSLYRLLPGDLQPLFARTVRDLVMPTYYRLGWTPREDEDVQTIELRGTIIGVLGTLGQDAQVRAKAARMFKRWKMKQAPASKKAPVSWGFGTLARVGHSLREHIGRLWNVDRWGEVTDIDPDVMPSVIGILAASGDKKRFDEFFALFQAAKDRNPQDENRFMSALAKFDDPELYKKATALALSEHIRSQDAPSFLASMLASARPDKSSHAWEFVQTNWDAMVKRYPTNGVVGLARATVSLDTEEQEKEVIAFLAEHPIESGTMAVSQALEQLRVNVALRQRETPRLVRYFQCK